MPTLALLVVALMGVGVWGLWGTRLGWSGDSDDRGGDTKSGAISPSTASAKDASTDSSRDALKEASDGGSNDGSPEGSIGDTIPRPSGPAYIDPPEGFHDATELRAYLNEPLPTVTFPEPLGKGTHYFFPWPVPRGLDEEVGESQNQPAEDPGQPPAVKPSLPAFERKRSP